MVRLRFRISVVVLAVFVAQSVEAGRRPIRTVPPDKRKYLAYNVSLTSVATLITAVVQHKVSSHMDAARLFLIGAGAGAAFYEAKRVTGAGLTTEGWLVANAASTLIENTTSGEHLLGRIGYTIGPLRLRFATPLARTGVANIEADWSLAETAFLALARRDANHVRLRNGLIAINRDTPWKTNDQANGLFGGRTSGVFPGVAPNQGDITWSHEMVHVIQCQQLDSVEPSVYTFGPDSNSAKDRRLFAFRHVRLGFSHLLNGPTFKRPYTERWMEVEAYGLAQRTPVHP
jgi:hypothetical protein